MCRRNICSIPLEFAVLLVLLQPLSFSLPLSLSCSERFPASNPGSLSLSPLFSVSSVSSNFFLHRAFAALVAHTLRYAPLRGYWTFRLHGRQVYFYSIRFIRLNMTCGYSPGDIFPILRDDIPTLVVPRVSCILCPYRSFSQRSLARSCRRPR